MKKVFAFYLFLTLFSGVIYGQTLYTQTGTDKAWKDIIRDKEIPIGVNSTTGIKGSKIDVKNDLVEGGLYKDYETELDIGIHTVANGGVDRKDFDKWSRWYQEDGKTQIFRLLNGEYNVRNDREGAPRIEAESKLQWQESEKKWHEWVGRLTIVKAQEVNFFQIFADPEGDRGGTGLMMIGLKANGDVYWNKRDGKTYRTMATNMVGKSMDIKVRDNGLTYELYVNGTLFEKQDTPKRVSKSHFRWGMYSHDNMTGDAIIFVSHAQIDGKSLSINDGYEIEKFSVYPNPSSDGIFNFNEELSYEVYDLSGRLISNGIGNRVNLSSSPKGVYILHFGSSNVKLVR